MDNPDIERYQRNRESFLTIALAFVVAGGFYSFLIFIDPFFLSILPITLGLGVLGCFHYFLWGRSYSRAVQNEREALESEEESPDWRSLPPPGERRF